MGPIARRDQFIITEAEQDLVIYDKRTCHLHTVPSPIAAVWRCCDGVRSVNEIAVAIGLPSPQVEAGRDSSHRSIARPPAVCQAGGARCGDRECDGTDGGGGGIGRSGRAVLLA
jgi:hypothetical protein